MKRRFPTGYWKDFDNVAQHLRPYIEQHGRLPKNKELSQDGLSMLGRAITLYHGGYAAVSKRLEVPTADTQTSKKPRDYWTMDRAIEKIHEYLAQSANSTTRPTRKELSEFEPSLLTPIGKFGLTQLLDNYQARYCIQLERPKKDVKWSEERICKNLRELAEEQGHLPAQSQLTELGLEGLRGAISKSGGIKHYSQLLCIPTKNESLGKRPSGYWDNPDNLRAELLPLIERIGHLPSAQELAALGQSDLLSAYSKYGGVRGLSSALELDLDSSGLFVTLDGHYVRSRYEVLFDNFLYLNNITHQTEGPISDQHNYLFDFRLTNLDGEPVFVEIWGYSDRHDIEIAMLYNEKRKDKEKVYQDNDLTLLSFEEHEFDKPFAGIYKTIVEKLKHHNVQHSFKPVEHNIEYFIGSAYSFDELTRELQPHIDELGCVNR
ncbi:MAG: hypothetical protein KDI14_18355 [Halioglobus sp.]|nr:hypothetical protein [Halioglobus sp.]